MRVRLLGPVEVEVEGQTLHVHPPQLATILAVLAAEPDRVVLTEVLIDRVWGERTPRGARRTLHTHMATLRRLVGSVKASQVVHRAGGYVLEIDPERVDLHQFRELVRCGGAKEALALWRGEPLAGLPGDWAARMRQLWHQERCDAAIIWARMQIADGEAGSVIGRLESLVDEYPLSEPVAAVLIRALHAAGRTAEALDKYARVRAHLVRELGIEPGRELQAAQQEALRAEAKTPAPPPTRPVPAQLPLDLRTFTGREAELKHLDAMTGAVIISGTPGVGKTALAVRWARRAAQRFPDGQLYVNLRGADPAGAVLPAAEVLRGFLDALGIPPSQHPSTVQAQTGLYRSLLSGRRVLVLLDNARDADQVRPLLAAAPGCLTLVTSRNQLGGLEIGEGANALGLDTLSTSEGREVLAARLGAERVAGEPEAAEQIIARCAGLPLALAIVAAKAAAHPQTTLAQFERQMRADLDSFAHTDPAVDLRAVFARSLRDLSPPAARLFRLMGLHPGPEMSVAAAASLARQPLAAVRATLDELVRANLVIELKPGRYWCHDLLHAYAIELCRGDVKQGDGKEEREAAQRRLLDHYLGNAYQANELCYPNREAFAIGHPSSDVTLEAHTADEAIAWFATEHPVLLPVLTRAGELGLHTHVWQLAWAYAEYLQRQGHWQDMLQTQHAALDSSRATGDREAQARSHNSLARAYTRADRHDEAVVHFHRAIELFEQLGELSLQAHVHLGLGAAYCQQADGRQAGLLHTQQALRLFRQLGDDAGEARALNSVGWAHILIGDYPQALANCGQAQAILARLGNTLAEAHAWDSLGFAHHHLHEYASASTCYLRALDLFRAAHHRHGEGETLVRLGDNHAAAGEPEQALDHWRRAVPILDELGDAQAEPVRRKIAA